MDKIKLEDLTGSEELKIEAAVLEIMEAKGFTLDKEFGNSSIFGESRQLDYGFRKQKM